jgi:CRISPR/Cas system CSM-associated protein Csm5 (group 7 of RAMP superfamily)
VFSEQRVFIASILVVTNVEASSYVPLYDKKTLLIHAAELNVAREKAEAYGRDCEVSYLDKNGIQVTKKFLGVADINEAVEVAGKDVTEVSSHVFQDFAAYEKFTEFRQRKY